MQKTEKTGLVLSGGAIRGIAHLGVLKFLQEAEIEPDIIAGASAGALVGAFYAAGYTAEESLAFFLKNKPITWRNYARRKPGILVFDRFAQSLAEQFPIDQFSALKKPLFITRTNLETGNGEIVNEGPLIKNLLASAAFPLLFAPIEINGVLYSDGGITNNFPIEPLLPLCKKTLGIYVNPLPQKTAAKLKTAFTVAERAFQISVTQTSLPKFRECNIVIIPKRLEEYSLINTRRIKEIFQIGYQAAFQERSALEKLFTK
ncbi:MAG: patatin-like phospholipase family protein [Lewinella sp.]|uniref:patatin-like phospholipase family protein n=1 Tax=Lewinella sp. TaxID=2004506 RepID=UPI003D6C282B